MNQKSDYKDDHFTKRKENLNEEIMQLLQCYSRPPGMEE